MGMLRRVLVGLLWLVGLLIAGAIALYELTPQTRPTSAPTPPPTAAAPMPIVRPPGDVQVATPPVVVPGPGAEPIFTAAQAALPAMTECSAKGYEAATAANAASLRTLDWTPFHRPEIGWETYAPRIQQEIGAVCGPDTPSFAKAMSQWQKAHRLPATGMMDAASFAVMNGGWELQRPFVRLSATGVCPQAPPGSDLSRIGGAEAYGGKPIRLRTEALDAYRRMVAAARAEAPEIGADHHLLTIISGYRTPEDDTAHCAKDGDCGNVTRALCSAHRTGLAVDLVLGAGPVASADDANRLRLSRTPAYAWMVANASRFGWVNYPFEPWHWEWTGAPQ